MIKPSNPGRGSWKYTIKIFLIHPQSSARKLHWAGLNTHNFSWFCLTQSANSESQPMKAYILAVALHIYVDMTNSIVCLKTAKWLQDSFSLSARANTQHMLEHGLSLKKKKNLWVYFFSFSPYVQGKRAVFEDNIRQITELVLHLPGSTINCRRFVTFV